MARMRKYWESKTTQIIMASVPHVSSGLELRKFQADGLFVDTSVHNLTFLKRMCFHAQLPSYLSHTSSLTQVAELWLLHGLTLNHHNRIFSNC